MFKKIRNRIMILNMIMVSAVVIAAFTVIFIIIYAQEHDARRTKLMSGATPQTISFGRPFFQEGLMLADTVDGIVATGFARRIEPDAGLSFSLLVDGEGNLIDINSMVDLPESIYIRAALVNVENGERGEVVELDGRLWQYSVSSVSVAFQEANDYIYTVSGEYNDIRFLDITDSNRMLESLGLTLSGLTVVILAAFFFISRLFANRAIRPMEESFDKQSRFIADASHELRTPLSVINANCGVLYANEDETVMSQAKWVDSIISAADRMTGLTDDLLSLTRMGDKEHELQVIPFDLSAAVADAVSDIKMAALTKSLAIDERIAPGIEIESDRGHILKIMSILLDNAVKYTNSGGEICVSLQTLKRHTICAVRNSGDGVPKEELPRLFDRFYRGDPARSSENEGYGLGLAIAKAAADRLGAELTATSEPGISTEFRLVI